MTADEAIAIYSSLSQDEQREFLAGMSHELTILARDGYETGGEGLTDPRRLRRLNEVQHSVSAQLLKLLRGDVRRYPDDVIVRIILEGWDDASLRRDLNESFARLASRRLSVA